MHEKVEIDMGPSHLSHLDTIVDPVVVSELPTMLWTPHGHEEAGQALKGMVDVALLDSDNHEEHLLKPGELTQALANLPPSAWPYGRVVAVNTAKVIGAESIGFSIAIDHGRRLINGETSVADRAAPDATRSDSDSNVFSSPRPPDSDERHHTGLASYDVALRAVASQADRVDSEWREYVTWCGIDAPSAAAGGRAWFAIWSAAADGGSARSNCPAMRSEILDHASRLKAAMTDISERARRAGVFPGEIRDLRRKYLLDYEGW